MNNSDYDNNIKQAELSATDEEKSGLLCQSNRYSGQFGKRILE